MKMLERAIRSMLSDFGTVIVRETSTGEFNCRCPMPDHEDSKASFSINKEHGMWNCFGCGRKGSLLFLYVNVVGVSVWRALEEIRVIYKVDLVQEFLSVDIPDWEDIKGYKVVDNERFRILSEAFAEHRIPQYLRGRLFDEDDWIRWEGGVDRGRGLIVFPVYTKSRKIIGLVGRSESSAGFRYMNYEGSDPKSTLYGVHVASGRREVVVVEGLFDVHRTYRSIGGCVDVVGLLSTQFSDTQVSMLRYWDKVYLWLDNDEEGRRAQGSLCRRLISVGKDVGVVPYTYPVKDQADMDNDQVQDCYDMRYSQLATELDGMLLT